jgi:hypothetical protein
MGTDAVAFSRALGLNKVDVLGFPFRSLQIPAVIGDKVAQSSVCERVGQQWGFP